MSAGSWQCFAKFGNANYVCQILNLTFFVKKIVEKIVNFKMLSNCFWVWSGAKMCTSCRSQNESCKQVVTFKKRLRYSRERALQSPKLHSRALASPEFKIKPKMKNEVIPRFRDSAIPRSRDSVIPRFRDFPRFRYSKPEITEFSFQKISKNYIAENTPQRKGR